MFDDLFTYLATSKHNVDLKPHRYLGRGTWDKHHTSKKGQKIASETGLHYFFYWHTQTQRLKGLCLSILHPMDMEINLN